MRAIVSIAKVIATLVCLVGAARTYFSHDYPLYSAPIAALTMCGFIMLSRLPFPAHTHSALFVLTASWLSVLFAHAASSTNSFLVGWPRQWPGPLACLVFILVLFSAAAGTSSFLFTVRPATAVAAAATFVFFHPMGNDTFGYTQLLSPGFVLLALPAVLVTGISSARLCTSALGPLYVVGEPVFVVTLGWLVAVPFQRDPFSSCVVYLWRYHLPNFALPASIAAAVLATAHFGHASTAYPGESGPPNAA